MRRLIDGLIFDIGGEALNAQYHHHHQMCASAFFASNENWYFSGLK